MAYDTITILDAGGVSRKIAVQTVETDELIQTMGLDQGGDPVGSGNPMHVQGDVLDDIKELLGDVPAAQIWKSFATTGTESGTDIWTPASGKKIAITHIEINIGGTTGGIVTLWFGASGDTSYTAGTDQPVGAPWEVAPSATVKPFKHISPAKPIIAATADHRLKITTSAGVTVKGVAYGYEI